MATDRLLEARAKRPEEEALNWALRPTHLGEYIGQVDLIERLSIAVQAAKARNEPLEHALFHGPPGLGKTTLAHVIAKEMGSRLVVTSGPVLAKGTDLVAALSSLGPRDVLFIDEIHRLPIAVEEFIYPAMEDFRIDVQVDSGVSARTVQIKCKPFTLIGATTRAGLLSAPLRSRFGMSHHLKFYPVEELLHIVRRSATMLNMSASASGQFEDGLRAIAERARGTPRIANRLLRRVRDFAHVKAKGELSARVVGDALALEGVDELGLDELDRAYLTTIATTYSGGPVGLETVAATMSEDAGTLEDVVEPYLLQIGFVARTRRGRAMTKAAADHLGMKWKPSEELRLLVGEGLTQG
ncbi:MAG: Holliday junction branch migration DNA helicase RuvB [Planctomycetota bacterium]|nr:Holliday junction branch migration DNA helicase RuvB [Planctomycetota bacterium]